MYLGKTFRLINHISSFVILFLRRYFCSDLFFFSKIIFMPVGFFILVFRMIINKKCEFRDTKLSTGKENGGLLLSKENYIRFNWLFIGLQIFTEYVCQNDLTYGLNNSLYLFWATYFR